MLKKVDKLQKKPWWDYLTKDLQDLFLTSEYLLVQVESWKDLADYSFIVFPAAKAYEGFLKKLFRDLDFISEADYRGNRFRIGKALNPQLDSELKKEGWVYEQLFDFCNGPELPHKLWQTWKECRNGVFHWYPSEEMKKFPLTEARIKVEMIIESVDLVFTECKLKKV